MQSNQKQKAFMEAYKSCHQPFMRYCSAMAFGKMDVEDLVQDVLLSAYHHFETIQDKDKFLHYLIRAARNRSISILRKRKQKTEWVEKHKQHLLAKGVAADTLLDIQLLYQAIQRLPERQASALILFEINGFSMKEIAEIQNTSAAAVKMKVSRGRKRLRSILTDRVSGQNVNVLLSALKSIAL